MFTPPGDEPPPLVDSNPPFIPPPHGASNGGQPGFLDAFPGARGAGGSSYPPGGSSPWGPPKSTPYPAFNQQPLASPWGHGPPPPLSAPVAAGGGPPPWQYGAYTPVTTPGWGPTSAPAAAAPASPWGAGPASASPWGAASGGSGWGPAAGGSAWGAGPASAGGGGYAAWAAGEGSHPGTPYQSAVGQPVTGGWFGSGGGGGGGGGTNGGWGSNRGGDEGWGTTGNGWGDQGAEGWGQTGGGADGGWGDWGDWGKEDRKGKKKRSESMKRSNSQGPPTRRPSMHRTHSWGDAPDWVKAQQQYWGGGAYGTGSGNATPNANAQPAYAQADYYDQNNLARRPRDWRADYVPSGKGLASYIPNLGRSRSNVKDYTDPERRRIHPLIDYETLKPALYYDLRSTQYNPSELEFFRIERKHNHVDLMQLATIPAAPFLRLSHPKLPWYVDIHQGQPNGVTIQDIFMQLHSQLHSPIHGRHFWNEELSEGDRIEITRAFQDRVKNDRKLVARGILQVDFLGKKFVLEGFVRGPKGIWEMKMGKAER